VKQQRKDDSTAQDTMCFDRENAKGRNREKQTVCDGLPFFRVFALSRFRDNKDEKYVIS
jgi:hypothetical protein